MDTSWQPRTSAVALAAVAASSSEYSVGACIIDSVPDGANLGLRAIQQGPCLACCVPQACTQRTYHRVYAFTDCAEALCFLIGIPCRHSAAHGIKHYCCSLHQVSHTAVAVRWIPGHVGLAGNKSAHRLASEACSSYRRQPGESIARAARFGSDRERRRHARHFPLHRDFLFSGLPRGVQVFLNRASSSFAIATNDVAGLQGCRVHFGTLSNDSCQGSTLSPAVSLTATSEGNPPSVPHRNSTDRICTEFLPFARGPPVFCCTFHGTSKPERERRLFTRTESRDVCRNFFADLLLGRGRGKEKAR